MTKVQVTYTLQRPLAESDWVNISRMHSVYGFNIVRPKATEQELFVEYDSSRLSRKEVAASLEEHGLPIGEPVMAPQSVPEPPHKADTKTSA